MDVLEAVMAGLPLIALAVASWTCAPYALLWTGIYSYKNGARCFPDNFDPTGSNDRCLTRYQQLLDLGFQPLGVHWEKLGVLLTGQEYVFGSLRHVSTAGLTACSRGLCFWTAFENGALVVTFDSQRGVTHLDTYRLTSVPCSFLKDVLVEHKKQVGIFLRLGYKALPCSSIDDYTKIARVQYSNSANKCRLQRSARIFFAFSAMFFILSTAVLCLFAGFGSPWPWLVVIISGLYFKWLSSKQSYHQVLWMCE